MAKTKRRERSEIEYLRGQVRKLETENRQLKKRVRALDKRAHFYEDLVDVVAEEIAIDDQCEHCKTGKIRALDLKYVKYLVCDKCDYKEKI